LKVELVDSMGSDLSVVNAARVSYNKNKTVFENSDERLIAFLARHNHWTPFGHAFITFRISAPIFVARQLVKHQVGLVWNEVSRRYVDSPPDFFEVSEWRGRPKNSKQGSDGKVVLGTDLENRINAHRQDSEKLYEDLLEQNVAPEQARMVLPQSTYTEWYWSGSLFAFSRVCNLRLKPDAQKETRDVALHISEICANIYPVSWKYLVKEGQEIG